MTKSMRLTDSQSIVLSKAAQREDGAAVMPESMKKAAAAKVAASLIARKLMREIRAILDRDLFDAVQAQLAERTVVRMAARSQSQAILTGLIFDDRGHTMSPTHASKKGVRYRYYVSQALQQHRKAEAGSVPRVSAPDVEALVCTALRQRMTMNVGQRVTMDIEMTDWDLVQRFVQRITVKPNVLELAIRAADAVDGADAADAAEGTNARKAGDAGAADAADETAKRVLTIPFTPNLPGRKGIAHAPASQESISTETRDNFLQAIARARGWMESIVSGKAASFEAIAAAENLAGRHVRFLTPLAFLSPCIVTAIANGTAPDHLTVTSLARALP